MKRRMPITGKGPFREKGTTPYHWTLKSASGWRIGFGRSSFLIAEGSGFSRDIGMKLYRSLEDDWHKRRKRRRPVTN